MNGWAIYALVVIAGPMLLIAWWLVADSLRARRQARFIAARQRPDWSVAAIQARVERERADEGVEWPEEDLDAKAAEPPTEMLPANEPYDEPTDVIPMVTPGHRKRRYGDKSLSLWPRRPLMARPDLELLARVREGLERM